MDAVTKLIAIVRLPILFESSHCSEFSKTMIEYFRKNYDLRLHLKSDLTAFETFSWIWYCIFSIFLTKSFSASMLRAIVRSAKWETKANNRGGFSWTWSSETKFSNDIPPDPFDVMREFIRSNNNECSVTDFKLRLRKYCQDIQNETKKYCEKTSLIFENTTIQVMD